jgi:Raf kinase inhibitor-like YbhB/YbcL family protein
MDMFDHKLRITVQATLMLAFAGQAWPAEPSRADSATPTVRMSGRRYLDNQSGGSPMSFNLESTVFKEGGDIPQKFTCDGADVSPPLKWENPPQGTKSVALIADDPDAPVGTWVHWVIYDLDPQLTELREGMAKLEKIPGIGKQGLNDFRKVGYGGPCPPPGKPHRYYFKLYALDTKFNLKPRATKQEVEQAMKGHIIAQAELMGRYKR